MYYLYAPGSCADHALEDRLRGTLRLLSGPAPLVTSAPAAAVGYGLTGCPAIESQLPRLRREDRCLSPIPRRGQALWGYMGPPHRALGRADRIWAWDRMTLEALRQAGLGRKARLAPDPVFLVRRQLRPLAGAFRRDTVALSLAPGAFRYEARPGLLWENLQALVRYILEKTPFQIALVPYCAARHRNEALVHQALVRAFPDRERFFLRPDGPSPQLRGDLSLCRMGVGMAGAAVAWTCGVPALCLGADLHAMGLAQSLFGDWREVVVPIRSLYSGQDLTARFRRFLDREDLLRKALEKNIPLCRQYAEEWDMEL